MMQSYYNPTKILLGNSIVILKRLLVEFSNKNILALYSNGFGERNKDIDKLFKNRGNIFIYNKVQYNPDIEYIYQIIKELENFNFDYIIAIGGGSVIDTAKAISAIRNTSFDNKDDLRDIIVEERYNHHNNFTPIMAIPTTSGTGSEVTSWGTVWDFKNNKKYSIASFSLYPQKAIIDPELTISLSRELTAITGLDALSHAIESFWAKKTNVISRIYAIKSIEIITEALPNILYDLSNLELRRQMALGSLYAGLAFSNTKTTACHSISYPLTMMYGIPHGIAVSMTLGKIFDINKKHIVNVDELVQVFKKRNVRSLDNFIKKIFEISNIKHNLKDYGVKKDQIAEIISSSFTKGRMDNNPVDITKDQLEDILIDLL